VNFNEYQEQAHCTEAPVGSDMLLRFSHPKKVRLIHAAMGMCTEAGEFQDQLKRHLFYGKPLDCVNLAEEAADCLWYIALACNALGISMEEIAKRNIEKLRTRYPDKFTEYDAEHRDLAAERKILEG